MGQECLPFDDPCANKHGGNPESVAAFRRASPTLPMARAAVLALIRDAGRRGMTAKEVAEALGKALNEVSGRCTELKAGGLVRPLLVDGVAQRRDGCAVLVAW